MKKIIIVFLVIFLIITTAGAKNITNRDLNNSTQKLKFAGDSPLELEWEKIYNSDVNETGIILDKTSDNGFIITIYSLIDENTNMVNLLKVNSKGNIVWENSCGKGTPQSLEQTSDGGFILLITSMKEDNTKIQSKLVKLNSDGSKNWEKIYGTSDYDNLYEAHQTKDNGYILIGTKMKGVTDSDIWVIKTNSNGKIEWEKTYGKKEGMKNNQDSGYSIYELESSGYIISGTTTITKLAPPSANTYAWIIKINSNGDIIKESILGEDFQMSMYMGYKIIETTHNNYILGCNRNLEADYKQSRFWLLSLNSNLEKISEYKNYNNIEDQESINCVNPTIDGGCIVVGTGLTFEDQGFSTYSTLIKFDSKLKKQWSLNYGISNSKSINYAKQTNDNGYIVTGGIEGKTLLIKYKLKVPTDPPNKPDRPDGPTRGNVDKKLSYSTKATDPAGAPLYFYWDWGDGTNSGWIGPYPSDETAITSHKWSSESTYEIKVKAKNSADLESEWSDSIKITIEKTRERNFFKNIEKINFVKIIEDLISKFI